MQGIRIWVSEIFIIVEELKILSTTPLQFEEAQTFAVVVEGEHLAECGEFLNVVIVT